MKWSKKLNETAFRKYSHTHTLTHSKLFIMNFFFFRRLVERLENMKRNASQPKKSPNCCALCGDYFSIVRSAQNQCSSCFKVNKHYRIKFFSMNSNFFNNN